MTATSEAYITNVAYPAHFHREMMPQWLHASLTGLGIDAPNIDHSFTWLELGCGSAVNLLTAAANYPHAQFVGIDISGREIQQAQQWAEACGLDNVQLLCADFGDVSAADALGSLLKATAKRFDFIVSHGVYSWVAPTVQAAMHRLIGQLLAPQGIAYLAYNSQPGAASLSATQRLLWLNAQRITAGSAAQVRNGLDLIMTLAKGGAGNYVEQPALLRELERIASMDEAYLAHEFLNRDWCAHHVADVMQALAETDCQFVGSATPIENINAFSLPAKLHKLFAHMQAQGLEAAQIETAKDIARNQNMRRDMYQKSPLPAATSPGENKSTNSAHLSESAHRARLLAQQLVVLPAAQQAAPRATDTAIHLPTRIGALELPVAQVQPILNALQTGTQSYSALAQLPAYQTNPGLLNPLLQTLAWAGWVQFVQIANSAAQAQAIAERVASLRQTLENAGLKDVANQIACLSVAPTQSA